MHTIAESIKCLQKKSLIKYYPIRKCQIRNPKLLFLLSLHALETPLTLAAQLTNSVEVIKALKNGGAHLDFRARDGMTALHKAARAKNQVTLKVNSFKVTLYIVLYRKV